MSEPITFAQVAVLPAATGLLDGQQVRLSATGLLPGVQHRLVRCDATRGPSCEPQIGAPVVTSDDQGTLELSTTATSRFTSEGSGRAYCRDQCTFRLQPDLPGAWPVDAPFAMAEGSLTATPSTGLAGGDTVHLAGTDLMPSHAGPAFWFFPSTGTWGVAQCGAAVTGEPTILGIFTNCTVAPPGTADVPASTASVDVPAAPSFTTTLGQEIDCTAGPRACVLALGRVEQDGSVSIHAAPIAFG